MRKQNKYIECRNNNNAEISILLNLLVHSINTTSKILRIILQAIIYIFTCIAYFGIFIFLN